MSAGRAWEFVKPALQTGLERAQAHWLRLVLVLVGVFGLAIEAFDLFVGPREQGWISFLGFAIVIAAGWFLLKHHHLGVVVVSLFLIPIGAIWLIPIVSQLGFIVLAVLGVRWVVLKVRQLAR